MSAKRRVATNTLVNIGALGLNAITQFLQVAVLSSVWPLERYGEWILLSTIPAYFALTDLGFSAAAQSEMTMAHARGDIQTTRTIYQSTWALMVFLSALTLLCSGILAWLLGYAVDSRWSVVSALAQLRWTAFLFVIYTVVSICARVVLAGFRSVNHYALGTILYEISLFLECGLTLVFAAGGASFDLCITAGIVSRVLWTVVKDQILLRQVTGMSLGFQEASTTQLRRMLSPALAAMATPISLALNLQGIVVVIGAVVSPVAVAVFTPVRTLSRVGLQLASTFNRATMPEVSRAASVENRHGVRRLVLATVGAALLILLPGALLFASLGHWIVELWTHHRISPPLSLVVLLAADMFVQGCWYFLANLLLSTNEHTRMAPITLVLSVLSVAVAIPAGLLDGLRGVATAILVADLATMLAVFISFRASSIWRLAFGATHDEV